MPAEESFTNKGGPHGLGDPDDKSLRRVEIEVCIPKRMRDIARREKCPKEVEEFTKCCKDSSYAMVVKCRPQNTALWDCLTKWYHDKDFKDYCTKLYLEERTEYRKTGMTQKEKSRLATSGF
ncbi:COX assembly mitochondrial protein homolog [Homarus americanus]|uniref:COX assembly mitochondrial protein n=1 Tax=Homarus americanus TaxID=6706 RepID=A0A8J5MJG8_HOMAM|nr:COX assembly mitochondrial protein homolog [Homarus americanus]KAG7153696.1 COX assembly mitochondrial protein-like [Homarus americanus]